MVVCYQAISRGSEGEVNTDSESVTSDYQDGAWGRLAGEVTGVRFRLGVGPRKAAPRVEVMSEDDTPTGH